MALDPAINRILEQRGQVEAAHRMLTAQLAIIEFAVQYQRDFAALEQKHATLFSECAALEKAREDQKIRDELQQARMLKSRDDVARMVSQERDKYEEAQRCFQTAKAAWDAEIVQQQHHVERLKADKEQLEHQIAVLKYTLPQKMQEALATSGLARPDEVRS